MWISTGNSFAQFTGSISSQVKNTAAKNFYRLFNSKDVIKLKDNLNAGKLDEESKKLIKKYLGKSKQKSRKLIRRINGSSKKYKRKLLKAENNLQKKLCKTDPALADQLYNYNTFNRAPYYNTKSKGIQGASTYLPAIDRLKNSTGYLTMDGCVSSDSIQQKNSFEAKTITDEAEKSISKSQNFQSYNRARKEQLEKSLVNHPELNKELLKYNKANYYSNQHLNDIKTLFKKQSKIEEKVLAALDQHKGFNDFAKFNSYLSKFKIPDNWGKSLDGIATNEQFNEAVKQRMEEMVAEIPIPSKTGLANANLKEVSTAKSLILPKMEKMQKTMNQVKSAQADVKNASDLPDFKPNPLKTKRLVDRLIFSNDFQFKKSQNLMPGGASIGLNISYQTTTKITIGTGGAYAFGLSNKIKAINYSTENLGIRSFTTYQLNKIIHVQMGFEKNYTRFALPGSTKELILEDYKWNNSALFGFKLLNPSKKGAKQLLSIQYDFLHNTHVPNTPVIVYRVGFEF